jgi:hypothetical protein
MMVKCWITLPMYRERLIASSAFASTLKGYPQNSTICLTRRSFASHILLGGISSWHSDRESRYSKLHSSPPSGHSLIPESKSLRRNFSTSKMTAKNIDGTAIAKSIREKLNVEIRQAQESNPRFKPSLTIIQGKFQRFNGKGTRLS